MPKSKRPRKQRDTKSKPILTREELLKAAMAEAAKTLRGGR